MKPTGMMVCVGLLCVSGSASAQDKSGPVKFAGDPAAAFGADNYPPDARRANQQGRVVAEITVGPDGHPTGCTVTSSSDSPSLDTQTCELAMTKVRYTAARDAAGKPIRGKIVLPVRWALDQDAPPVALDAGPVQVMKTVIQYDLWIDGTSTGCRFLEPAAMVSQACPPEMIGRRMTGAATIKGKPVPSRLTITQINVIEAKTP